MRSLWCVALLTAAVAAGQHRQPGDGINEYSRASEIATGEKMASDFGNRTTPLGNAAVTDYVNRLGSKLVAQFPGGWPYRFEVIQENTGGLIHEPAAFPGGPIFVSVDLITAAANEAEFAGMMAHAMSHVADRDWTKNATRLHLVQDPSQFAQTGMWEGPAGVPVGYIQFERASERQADYLAVKTMAAAGYDPEGLASYLKRVQPRQRAFDPLPAADERVQAIRSAAGKLSARTYEAGGQFASIQAQAASH